MTRRQNYLPSIVLGFHGCDRKVAEGVLTGRRRLRPSTNEYDWLGSGSYFREGDATRALEWPKDLKGRKKIKTPDVVGAIIDLGNCLNLLGRFFLSNMRDAYQQLVKVCEAGGTPLPQSTPVRGMPGNLLRYLDCITINTSRVRQIEQSKAPFDAVRAAFVEGEPVYTGAGFNDQSHIQICVMNAACVKGYFRPIDGGLS